MATSSSTPSTAIPTPSLMIGWTGSMTINRNFGAWVLESPTPAQLQVFKDASFDLSQPGFAPPALMEEAGATYYPNRRSCSAIKQWLWNDPPHLLIGFGKGNLNRVGIWTLHYPTTEQRKIFTDAGVDLNKMRFAVDADLMKQAGATLHPDMNVVPEVVSVFFAPPTFEERVGVNLFGWPMTGGVWALLSPSLEQLESLREGGYDFASYDSEDRWHGLLEKVGAVWFADPWDVKDEVEKISPGMQRHEKGTRGGVAA